MTLSNGSSSSTDYAAAKDLNLLDLDVELRNPLTLLEGLSETELLQLSEDIAVYLQLEERSSGTYVAFWQAMRDLTNAELKSLREDFGSGCKITGSAGLHKAVEGDIHRLLAGKSSEELKQLEADIEKDLREGRRRDTVRVLFASPA